jgi:hypothetical protein
MYYGGPPFDMQVDSQLFPVSEGYQLVGFTGEVEVRIFIFFDTRLCICDACPFFLVCIWRGMLIENNLSACSAVLLCGLTS